MSRSACGVLLLSGVRLVWLSPLKAQVASGTIAGPVKYPGGLALTGSTAEVQPLKEARFGQSGPVPADGPASRAIFAHTFLCRLAALQYNRRSPRRTGVGCGCCTAGSLASEEVIVTAEMAQGEAEAINIERTADNIVEVLPSQVINSLPNTNVADAVGRLPSVTLERDEGEGKYVQIRGPDPVSNLTIDEAT